MAAIGRKAVAHAAPPFGARLQQQQQLQQQQHERNNREKGRAVASGTAGMADESAGQPAYKIQTDKHRVTTVQGMAVRRVSGWEEVEELLVFAFDNR